MNKDTVTHFLARWEKYFAGAELPIAFYYTDNDSAAEHPPSGTERHCFIADLGKVRKGRPLMFGHDDISCTGGRRYSGFSQTLRPNFEYFLSCGIPGTLEGERYKKSPELVKGLLQEQQPFHAPARYLVFKRVDQLTEKDSPTAVIFFANPDVLSGLFTLVNFDEESLDAVRAPMGSGCSAIIYHPYHQSTADHPKAILGMFDVSARPYVPADRLTLTVTWPKFEAMVANMDESFLTTGSWEAIRTRIARTAKAVVEG